ncbi:hypothetical protein N4G70_16705 [Streptomyces sp. ASQP_92]|uniref:hypothetical protein n=1 Tax=Streptomyces sp. ASQP_92 TaxID=2979116 RepID=UPI0021C0ACD4|nr:hypothetical protein [Streptomyces sp. ASQP_92]MCT9090492.1 hypothetical protein [Streptomyces sp. ASQP_92]
MRLRIERTDWPRPGLYLTDTPRPDCPQCQGEGGIEEDYGDETGDYAGTNWWPCTCWHDNARWLLLALPRRRPWGQPRDPWATDEPPF